MTAEQNLDFDVIIKVSVYAAGWGKSIFMPIYLLPFFGCDPRQIL